MKLENTLILNSRFHAADMAEHMAVAYWQKGQDRAFHIARAIEAFDNLATLIAELKEYQK